MKQDTHSLKLRDVLQRDEAWGHQEGKETYEQLVQQIDAHPEGMIVRISLAGIKRTDASFARASVVELAHRYRGRRGVCLVQVPSEDVLENWDAAALHREQHLIAWVKSTPKVLGPKLNADTRDLLNVVFEFGEIGTAEAAKALSKQVPNVSTRLKRLCDEGLVLRREVTAPSGGLEFRYFAIK